MDYYDFLKTKQTKFKEIGFEVDPKELNPMGFDFQNHAVKLALKIGRFALFEDCGLGKTYQQIEWAYHVSKHCKKPVLILAPLAVVDQTINEGIKFGREISKINQGTYITNPGIYITNYEKLKDIDSSIFAGVVLDESSILKNFEGKIRNLLIEKFKDTDYRLCCTATPSPNDSMELGNHSEFLGVMSRNEMLAMFFIHDSGETSKWRLKRHGVDTFYNWVSSWALMASNPCDLGFNGDSYILPNLNYIQHEITTPKQDNGKLFNDSSVSATDFNKALRETTNERMKLAAQIARDNPGQILIIVKQNQEADIIKKLLPESIEVRGNEDPDKKAQKLLAFGKNEYRILVTKAKIVQFGLNYQNCNTQIHPSIDFSFEQFYQTVRRSWRFGQKKPVNIHVFKTDTMKNVTESIKRKESDFLKMRETMQGFMNYAAIQTGQIEEKTMKTKNYISFLGDTVKITKEKWETESIDYGVFSPPFPEIYTYSNNIEDMGNSNNFDDFCTHFSFLVPEIFRVLKCGRNVSIHCMDLPIMKGKEGFIGLRDFSGYLIKEMEKHGFIYHSRVTIWKNPVVEMQRTKALGLLHKQLKKDSTMSRVGIPDYILTFRKPGENQTPIKTDIHVDLWQQWASPVWMDINQGNTLNKSNARGTNDEKHICPLQLDVIHRLIELYSNPGEVVGSFFAGIGSEGYQALLMGRKFQGNELKKSYWVEQIKNLNNASELMNQLTLF